MCVYVCVLVYPLKSRGRNYKREKKRGRRKKRKRDREGNSSSTLKVDCLTNEERHNATHHLVISN